MKKVLTIIVTLLATTSLLSACGNSKQKNSKEDNSQMVDKATKETLKTFGENFLNYDSVDERNKSVKDMMTEKAQKDNGINVKVHADFQAKGQIKQIYRDIDNKNQYLIFADYQVQLQNTNVVLRVTMKNNKIDKLTVDYTRQAY